MRDMPLAVRQALLAVDGVVSATVSYDDKRADVQYHSETVAPAGLIGAINDAGSAASSIEQEHRDQKR